jgi:hypothetical protein
VEKILAKINKLTNWQALLIIALIGFAVFSVGLNNQFEGDDYSQILENSAVHSITNISKFFVSGTYAGNSAGTLSGTYYRPLMTTVFSLIYTLFGPHQFYFHIFQLLICIGSTVLLYLLFRYSFKPALALFLALIFLVHPIDSQVVYGIPEMQDALFFFFGILALYLLIRRNSVRSLVLVAICLFLSLLAKETAMVFVIMALIYLFWWQRQRFLSFLGIVIVPIILWFVLRLHAVGLLENPKGGPIDRLDLAARLLTSPSILLLYITKFIFPWKLASTYYWTYPTYSVGHFLVPLLIDLAVISLIVAMAVIVRKRATRSMFYTYIFFFIWTAIGVGLLLQIIPLDMTASESWFYFSMAGFLGMIGVILTVIPIKLKPQLILVLAVLLVVALGVRTTVRGLDWRSQYELAMVDINNTQDNARAYSIVVYTLMSEGNYSAAKPYQMKALSIYPAQQSYINYATILYNLGDYAGAVKAYQASLLYGTPSTNLLSEDALGYLTLLTGNPIMSKAYLNSQLKSHPKDALLWAYLAVLEDRNNDNSDAKMAIANANRYGQIPPTLYNNIMENKSFSITLSAQTFQTNINVP